MSINSGKNPNNLTEEEASLYDRQMRLWGIEAQQRMRNATILVVHLKGIATEAIKNMVLAGIGKLIILDSENVAAEDLGAGFFFRDEDVGCKRADAAKPRIEELNPLVNVESRSQTWMLDSSALDDLVQTVDMVCVTDWDRNNLVRVNEICRKHGKPFYSGGSYGLLGYIFCDLIKHDYLLVDRSAPKDKPRTLKASASYPTLTEALCHRWSNLTKRQTKELAPAVVFTILAIWEFESVNGSLVVSENDIPELTRIANRLVEGADVNKEVLTQVPLPLLESSGKNARHEFAPVCAIVGGMLAQDILKTLGGRDPPIANFFTFNGNNGGGTVCRMNMP